MATGMTKVEALYAQRQAEAAAAAAAGTDLAAVGLTPLETAEGSDEVRFALFASGVVAAGVGLWFWMASKKKKRGKRRRRAPRGFLL